MPLRRRADAYAYSLLHMQQQEDATVPARIITRDQLKELVPYSLSHIARLEQAGKFPQRLRLGPNRVGWLSNEVENWIESCAAARRDQ